MKGRETLDPKRVEDIAEDILANGQQSPILVRRNGQRYVLVEGPAGFVVSPLATPLTARPGFPQGSR